MQVVAWLSRKHRVVLRWRFLTCFSAVVYAGSLYIATRAHSAGRHAGPPPSLPHAGLRTIAAGVQLFLTVAAAVADFMR